MVVVDNARLRERCSKLPCPFPALALHAWDGGSGDLLDGVEDVGFGRWSQVREGIEGPSGGAGGEFGPVDQIGGPEDAIAFARDRAPGQFEA
jgi:hypothetical protein